MSKDRRAAPRHHVPEGLTAAIGDVAVRLIELSLVGAKVEHQERFALSSPQLRLTWKGERVAVPVRPARSEIVGREGTKLIYHTGLAFIGLDQAAERLIAAMLRDPVEASAKPVVVEKPSVDDSWTRQVHLLRNETDDHLPYAQFRLTEGGWEKDYVASPDQPADGFTIPREQRDFDELQRTFEAADPETRRMMQIALESQLLRTK